MVHNKNEYLRCCKLELESNRVGVSNDDLLKLDGIGARVESAKIEGRIADI